MVRRTLLSAMAVLALIAGCKPQANPWKGANPDQLKVLASFPPLYCWAANVGGDDAFVQCLLADVGPHDYEANAADGVRVRHADFFVINGLELDDGFSQKLIGSSKSRHVKLVQVGEAIPHDRLLHSDEEEEHKKDDAKGHKHDHKHDHKHGDHDPHIWLHPEIAAEAAEILGKKFGEAKPGKKKAFEERAAAYAKQLRSLHREGVAAFEGKKNRRIITMHDSLAYFAQAYGLEIVGSLQSTPGTEADAAQMTKLAQRCKEKAVAVIAVEPQYSKKSADTLKDYLNKKGTPVEIVEFDTLETAPADALKPDLYLKRMKENIERLAKALP